MKLPQAETIVRAAAGVTGCAAAAVLVTESIAIVITPGGEAPPGIAAIGLALTAAGIALTAMPGRRRRPVTAAGVGGLLTTVAWWQSSDRMPSGLIWRFITLAPMLALVWSCHLWKSAPHPGESAGAD